MILAALALSSAAFAFTAECVAPQAAPHASVAHAAALGLDLTNVLQRLKNDDQVDRWISCYRVSDARHEAFARTYRAQLARAATATGVPYALLACLFFTESKWDASASSSTGAIGLAQLMPSPTLGELNALIGATDQEPALAERLRVHRAEMKRRHVPAADAEARAGEAAIAAERELNAARLEAQRSWRAYWPRGHVPRRLERADLENPERAIGAGATYLKYILLKFDYGGPTALTRLLVAAGAYNRGPAGMMRAYARGGRNYNGVLRELAEEGNTETPSHMERVRRCAERGVWQPGDEKDPRKCTPHS